MSISKILYGFLFLAVVAQFACSGESPTMATTAMPVPAGTPELTASSGSVDTPTQPPTEVDDRAPTRTVASTPTATAIPTDGGTAATPTVTPANVDREALIALYEATGGPNWNNNENWLSPVKIGEWYGVTTDANGRVIALNLGGNNLIGELPSELGSLATLEELYIVHCTSSTAN